MSNYTKNSYEMKRNITKFVSPLISNRPLEEQRFISDMFYGILKAQSLIVSDIARNLENGKSVKTNFKRLQRHLGSFNEYNMMKAYQEQVSSILGKEPIFLVDDSDIQKPYGKAFEDLGRVRDGSAKNRNTWGNGYNVSQIVGLTEKTLQPVPIAHHIYSQREKEHKSQNDYTRKNIELALCLAPKNANFIFDRGYDDKALMAYLFEVAANFVIRAGANRKYMIGDTKYTKADIIEKYKGKYKHKIKFQGDYRNREIKLSFTKVQLLDTDMPEVTLVLVYGIKDEPMILLTNREVASKEDVITIFNMYFLRWRIEEFFRGIKQIFGFENMRVQSLKRMNTLSWCLQFVMGYQAYFIETQQQNMLLQTVKSISNAYKEHVSIWMYQISVGIQQILHKTHTNLHAFLGLTRTQRNRMQMALF